MHIDKKQAVLGKSGYELVKPGVVRPVERRGLEFGGLFLPLAQKYG